MWSVVGHLISHPEAFIMSTSNPANMPRHKADFKCFASGKISFLLKLCHCLRWAERSKGSWLSGDPPSHCACPWDLSSVDTITFHFPYLHPPKMHLFCGVNFLLLLLGELLLCYYIERLKHPKYPVQTQINARHIHISNICGTCFAFWKGKIIQWMNGIWNWINRNGLSSDTLAFQRFPHQVHRGETFFKIWLFSKVCFISETGTLRKLACDQEIIAIEF